MIHVYLYGKFRELADNPSASGFSKIEVEFKENESLADLIRRIGLNPDETGDLFVNHYLFDLDWVIPHDESRVALFPEGMRLIDGGQYLKMHGYVTKKPPTLRKAVAL